MLEEVHIVKEKRLICGFWKLVFETKKNEKKQVSLFIIHGLAKLPPKKIPPTSCLKEQFKDLKQYKNLKQNCL